MSLQKLREEIDSCDARIKHFFEKRMHFVEEIAGLKKELGLPFYDPGREEAILAGLGREAQELFRKIMELSRERQARLLFPFNIVLIGFMGTGKTSVGQKAACLLGRPFYDLDQIIEKTIGMPLPQYFQRRGEASFRRKEKELLCKFPFGDGPKVVLAVGGGAVLDPENAALLRAKARLVLLTASSETIFKRIGAGAGRPLLGPEATADKIKRLQKARAPIYAACTQWRVDTDGLTVQAAAAEVLNQLALKSGS
ncbi:MAG: hypothetical protein GX335_03325 [Firmicutes bacterium]|nr:hypothetical protein [Bacillota bacterium]